MEENFTYNLKFVLNPSPEEQVFSNALLVDMIWNHLDSQALIRASLVSKAWSIKCRKTLLTHQKYPVYIQIDDDSPCRSLEKFSKFLEENYDPRDSSIIFNGIQLKINEAYRSYSHRCKDCIVRDPSHAILTGGGPRTEKIHLIPSNIHNVFGNILKKIRFRYIRLQSRIGWIFCPFPYFMQVLLPQNEGNILELDLGAVDDSNLVSKFLWTDHRLGIATKFPNLEILGIPSTYLIPDLRRMTPRLRKIIRLKFNPWHRNPTNELPLHAIINLGTLHRNQETINATIAFLEEFQPKIENVYFDRNPTGPKNSQIYSEEFQHDLFRIGTLVYKTLTTLTCPTSFLKFFSCKFNKENRSWLTNQFASLESLDLMDDFCVEVMDWFGLEDFSEKFPKLKEIRLNFPHLRQGHHNIIQGPFNLVQRSRGMKRVTITSLILEASYITEFLIDFAPRFLCLFGNVRYLNLTKIPFSYDCADRVFAEVFGEIANLPGLEELTIRAIDLISICLDHLFSENIPDIKKLLQEQNHFVYKTSVLDITKLFKDLKKINIHGEGKCNERRKPSGVLSCYRAQIPKTFLVSSRTAQLICKHRPAFKFCLKIDKIRESYCSCYSIFRPEWFRLEHLEPHTKISTHETLVKRIWDIEFRAGEC